MTYRLTRRARADVLNIWRYIAQDNEPAADRFIDLLIHHFRLLGDNNYAGRRREEMRPRLSQLPSRGIPNPLSHRCTRYSDHARGAWEAQLRGPTWPLTGYLRNAALVDLAQARRGQWSFRQGFQSVLPSP